MNLSIGATLHNFTVTNIRPVPGKDAELVEMRYEKTGTELVWFRSSESNKLFGIAFKTIPQDDTGVFHILEHSVLCGSDKYPVKEPFVELLKSSMNTFLNAMTFPDKTLYPVSSRNAQDFLNLTEVYLDAVFAPKILTNPNIFRQEGWHYELKDGNLSYNGVVFNEMKGAMSSVDEVAVRGIMHLVFPDNCYQYNSGGEPAAIPNLSYQQFVDTYKENYHPTNARIYLDGDIPVEETFALLDSYLSRYEMGHAQTLEFQTPVQKTETAYYEAVNDGTPKAQLVLGKILGTYDDKVKNLARQILCEVLADSNNAPLKRALLESGLCQDVSFYLMDELIQPFMTLRIQGMEQENAQKLMEVVRTCATKLVTEGIPKDRLNAAINNLIFQLKQPREPQGLIRCMTALNSWLYGGDPMLLLHYEDACQTLRDMVEQGGFEPLLEEMLLKDEGLCVLHVLPSETYGAQLREEENARLEAEKAALSQEQLQEIEEIQTAFTAWQQTPDSPEALATVPMLTLDQISPEPVWYDTTEDVCQGVGVIRTKLSANGIVYLTMYLRLTDLSLEDLTQVAFLNRLLGRLPTAQKTVDEIQTSIKTHLGDLSFHISAIGEKGRRDTCIPVLEVHCSVLQENLQKAIDLITEILTQTDFRQPGLIKEILLQTETDAQQNGIIGGHALAMKITRAHYSAQAAAAEALSGITYIRWLHDFAKNFDEMLPEYTQLVQRTLSAAVVRERLIISLGEDGHSDVTPLVEALPSGSAAPIRTEYQTRLPKKVGIRIPAQVSYAAMGYHTGDAGLKNDGSLRILSNILSLGYLWNEVRVQGGAYGAGIRGTRGGSVFTYSYRDPSPNRSLGVYRNMGNFVREFAASGEDITGYIISTIAETEPLMSPWQQGVTADTNWFNGTTLEEERQERAEILHATTEDLGRWGDMFDAMAKDAAVCVVGYADALDGCSEENLTIFDI